MIRSAVAASFAVLLLSAAARADTVAAVEQAGGPLPVPPGARYHLACSEGMGRGVAVFTFDLEADAEGYAAIRAMVDAGAIPFDTAAIDRKLMRGAQGAAVHRTEALLKQQGLRPVTHDTWTTTYVRGARDGHGPLEIAVGAFNPFCLGLMPNGPVIFFSAR